MEVIREGVHTSQSPPYTFDIKQIFNLKHFQIMENLAENIVNAIVVTRDNEAIRNMPIFAGDVFHIHVPTTEDEAKALVQQQEGGWDGVPTEEGMVLSVTSLTRNGNGLNLNGDTRQARLGNMLSYNSDGRVALRVTRVQQRMGFSEEGQPQARNYYFFAFA